METLNTHDKSQLYDIIQTCHHTLDFKSAMSGLGNLIQFNNYSACLAGFDASGKMTDKFINEIDYPVEYVEEYTTNAYYREDPVIIAQTKEPGIINWADAANRYATEKTDEIFSLSANWGNLQSGIILGQNTAYESCFLSLACDEVDVRDEMILKGVLPSLSTMLRNIRADKMKCTITDKERELIRAIKLGGTNPEIAEIMGCSVAYVKKLSASLVEKMDAITKTSAVVEAVRLGID